MSDTNHHGRPPNFDLDKIDLKGEMFYASSIRSIFRKKKQQSRTKGAKF